MASKQWECAGCEYTGTEPQCPRCHALAPWMVRQLAGGDVYLPPLAGEVAPPVGRRPFIQAELDQGACDNCGDPDCALYMTPRCCSPVAGLGVPVHVKYRAGILTVACAQCGRHVADVKVAES